MPRFYREYYKNISYTDHILNLNVDDNNRLIKSVNEF